MGKSSDRRTYFQQFKDEINIMKQVHHKNLITLQDVFEDITKLYLVMEECVGGELFDRIQAQGRYSEKDAASVLRDLAEGIKALHDKKIAHCDLKPDNCLFVDLRQDSALKIIDFGMSKYSPNNNVTGFRGTPYYVAPEIITSEKYTYHCDMWSFGVITFVMLFGFPPFHSRENDDNQIFRKIRAGFQPVTKKRFGPWFPFSRKVSQAAKDFIANCLQTDINKRYSADEALADPWLTGKAASNEPLLENVLSGLTEFTAVCKFKAAVLLEMTDIFTEHELVALKKTFQSIDANGDGTITVEELRFCIQNQATNMLSEEQISELQSLELLIQNADVDGDGKLSYPELLATAANRKLKRKEERIHQAFCKFDHDGDGKISVDDFLKVLGAKNTDMSSVQEMFSNVDKNNDGFVDYDEFLGMWKNQEEDRMSTMIGQR